MIPLHRRDFFKIAGGGLYIFFQLGNPFKILSTEAEQRRILPKDYNAFLRIAENGEVSCFTGKIETVIPERNEPPQRGGEPAIICMGAVIAKAIFDATGARLYQMPMTPKRVLEALKKVN